MYAAITVAMYRFEELGKLETDYDSIEKSVVDDNDEH